MFDEISIKQINWHTWYCFASKISAVQLETGTITPSMMKLILLYIARELANDKNTKIAEAMTGNQSVIQAHCYHGWWVKRGTARAILFVSLFFSFFHRQNNWNGVHIQHVCKFTFTLLSVILSIFVNVNGSHIVMRAIETKRHQIHSDYYYESYNK